MPDVSSEPRGKPAPHPSARMAADVLAATSCATVGEVVGLVVRGAFGLWTYTPAAFMLLSVILLPRIMHRRGYRMPPKPSTSSSDRSRTPP